MPDEDVSTSEETSEVSEAPKDEAEVELGEGTDLDKYTR